MSIIKLDNLIPFFIALSMLFYALRGKLGAIIATCYIVVLLVILLREKIYRNTWNNLCSAALLIFAVILHFARSISAEYYLIIGYFAAALICLKNRINFIGSLWQYLKYISIFEAIGVYLQRIFPDIYYMLMSIILPNTVVESIKQRLLDGYYTGFTREVSYTMFLIVIGINTHNAIKINIIIVITTYTE